MWMGAAAFRFYIPAAVQALVAGAPLEDAYALASFAGTLEHRLAFRPDELRPVACELASACRQIISAHADTFIHQAEIYGDLQSRYAALQDALTNTIQQVGFTRTPRLHRHSIRAPLARRR
jgi:hypothetical protein